MGIGWTDKAVELVDEGQTDGFGAEGWVLDYAEAVWAGC